jgi:hypothetical protein
MKLAKDAANVKIASSFERSNADSLDFGEVLAAFLAPLPVQWKSCSANIFPLQSPIL